MIKPIISKTLPAWTILASLIALNLSCGKEQDSSQLDGSYEEHTFWEKELELGDRDRFLVKVHPYIKNGGEKENRKTVTRMTADGWVFDKQVPSKDQDEGQMLDVAAIVNRGKFSSYAYVRILGETKWEHHSPEPKLSQAFTQEVKGSVRYPVLMGGLAGNIAVDGEIHGVLSANMSITSPEPYQIAASFNPQLSTSASAKAEASTAFWAKAQVKGLVELVDYGFTSDLTAEYTPETSSLSSRFDLDNHRLKGLGGKLSIEALLGPDSDSNRLEKALWKLVTKGEDSTFEHVIYEKESSELLSFDPIHSTGSQVLPEKEEIEESLDCAEDPQDVMDLANSQEDPSARDNLVDEALALMIHCGI